MNDIFQQRRARLSDDSGATFLIRWRGKQEGPYTASALEAKLAANQIGLLHEISHRGEWVTIRDYLAERDAALLAEPHAREKAERQAREESERQARAQGEQKRREQLLAEEGRDAAKAESEFSPDPQARVVDERHAERRGTSAGFRRIGMVLLLGGLAITAFFFLAFDVSVESGVGRVDNLGLMADRQNGIVIGVGIGIVGAIMLAVRSRNKN